LFSVGAIGTAPLSYFWRFAQAQIPGANGSSYTRTNVQCVDAGPYDVVVSNAYGSVTSGVASLFVVAQPNIAVQPANQTVYVSQSATFIMSATNQCGNGLTYQWRFSGTNLAGATTNSFTRTNAQPADAGGYAVVVSNFAGSVTSVVATLTMLNPPSILSPGLSGSNFVFSFNTVPGFGYIVQYKDFLTDLVWQTLETVPGDGTVQTITNATASPAQRFYRLSVQ
jgi:hypothetical protein